jgi:hypothetical protein
MKFMERQQQTFLGWSGVLIATVLMMLSSGLILYPTITNENILTALRVSSLTTALPFLLIFVTGSLTIMTQDLGRWLQTNRRYLWLILTISHLIHLFQIFLYYQLGQSCSLTVWIVTSPLWIIMVIFSAIEISNSQLFAAHSQRLFRLLYSIGIWYIWLIFSLAFGLGAVAKHIPFYNIPAFVLFLAAAIINVITWWRQKS